MKNTNNNYYNIAGRGFCFDAKSLAILISVIGTVMLASPATAQNDCSDRGGQSANIEEVDRSSRVDSAEEQPRVFVKPSPEGETAEGQQAISRLAQSVGISAVETLVFQSTQIWTFTPDQDEELVLQVINDSEFIAYAELDRYRETHSSSNDSFRCSQWYVDNVAPSYFGRAAVTGADLKLNGAWDITTGSEQVIIAVIDDGADLDHPDLADNLWENTAEIPGNLLDDDNNGYTDDIHGWDFNRNDNDPNPDSSGRNHGTAVAGAFGAVGNNTEGIAGANWNVSVMVLKTDFSVSSTVRAMEYAAENGATIINTSFGGAEFSRTEYATIEALRDAGILVVASAGNEHWDNDFGPNYPGSYDLPNIIAVAASSTKDDFTSWTQYGQVTVDVAAPGDAIITIEANGSGGDDSYAVRSGTSFSSPLVAGVAGLIKSRYPAADYREIKARILASVDPIADAKCAIGSGGRVNALAALEISEQPVPVLSGIEWVDAGNGLPDTGEAAVIKLSFDTMWSDAGATEVAISSGDPAIQLLTQEQTLPVLKSGESFTVEFDAKAASNLSGHHRVPLTVTFSSPGFTAERTVCLIAAPLKEGQAIESVLQTNQLDDVQRFYIDVPEDAPRLKLTTDSTRNVDLYARFSDWPMRDEVLRTGTGYTADETTVISAEETGDEEIDIVAPQAGTWHVMVVNAGQRSDTQYTLNNNFGRAVNGSDNEPDTEPETEPETEPGEAESESQVKAVDSVKGSGGGGAAGGVLLMLVAARLRRLRFRF